MSNDKEVKFQFQFFVVNASLPHAYCFIDSHHSFLQVFLIFLYVRNWLQGYSQFVATTENKNTWLKVPCGCQWHMEQCTEVQNQFGLLLINLKQLGSVHQNCFLGSVWFNLVFCINWTMTNWLCLCMIINTLGVQSWTPTGLFSELVSESLTIWQWHGRTDLAFPSQCKSKSV